MSTHLRPPRLRGSSALRRAGPLALLIAATLILAPAASPAGSYTDPAGDNSSAGDITGLNVAGDKTSGQLTFRISGSNLSTSDDVPTVLFIDSDANPLTGMVGANGADYVFFVGADSYEFVHWNGADLVDTPSLSVHVFGGSSALVITVNKSEIGNPADVNFWATSLNLTTKQSDEAPNDGAFNYSLDADGPLINSVDVQSKPSSGPKAGKPFAVTPTALHLPPDGRSAATPLLPESYTCTAKLGAKALKGSGTGGCTFRIPKKKARGKQLTVTVTVVYEGATKAFPFSFKVR
jgi:hypothetical protein